MRNVALSTVILMTALSWAATLDASTITYADKEEWANSLSSLFLTEGFTDDDLNFGVEFTSSESGHVNPALGYYQDVLASESQNEPMTTWTFGRDITAYGGNWTLGGPGGSGNSLLVYIDGQPTSVGYISNSYNGGFWGFISDTPVTSVTLVGGSGLHQQNYRLDDMVYSPYPAPMLSGDLDGNGVVGSGDLDIVRANWLTSVLPGDLSEGDASGDGAVTAADLDAVRSNWASEATASAFAVPEPCMFFIFALGIALATWRRDR